MTRLLANAGVLVMMLGACGGKNGEPGQMPVDEHLVGGSVRGLWTGSEGVTLELDADGASSTVTVSANGTFSFADPVAQGASYAVKVASNPMLHTCVVDAGAAGRSRTPT